MLSLIRHFLADVEIKEVSADVSAGAPRTLRFRPSMGTLQIS
jgi:chemotaxis receptor (MCP) glutamine deamidase CheD